MNLTEEQQKIIINKDTEKTSREIFPQSMISGSVRSQEELDTAFLKYPNLSRTYVQTALHWKDTRKWYEDNWPRIYKYLDKDFIERFQMEGEHHARAWEFHIAAVFSEKGLQLKEKTWNYGPDFCINISDDRRIWVEAIACDLGTADPVEPEPHQDYSFIGGIEDINRPRALRITSAIKTKLDQFNEYLENSKKSGVTNKDCLMIAVNGNAIQHFSEPSILFKKAVFGQGLDVYFKSPGKEKLQGPFYKPTLTITRKKENKDDPIPAIFMEMSELSKISAVLYCGHNVSLNRYEAGDDFLFAYHVNPDNPIPEGTFKFGRGIRKDPQTSTITDQEQK